MLKTRGWHQFLCALLLVPSLARRAPGADKIWAVVARGPTDSRLQSQLSELAAEDHVHLSNVRSLREASRQRPALILELATARNPAAFGRALEKGVRRHQRSPRLAPDVVRDGYILQLEYRHSSVPYRIRVAASAPEGFHNALLRVPDVLRLAPRDLAAGMLPAPQSVQVKSGGARATVIDYPSFPQRGIVEGFYGTPWSHQDRLDILQFAGAHRMDAYYYAPKDDPYHRKLWRDPYPPEQMKNLAELVAAARQNFVDFCFAISPGLSIAYSSDEDFAKLTAKLDSVRELGVGCLALFLDDVPEELQNPADKARFKDLGQAHVYLINKLYHYLESHTPPHTPAIRFTVTPTTYTNAWGSREYIKELGRGVDPHVDLVWTGREVVSPTITVADAREWGKLLRRPPLIWDNFPVNDGIPWRLNLGPLVGRDPDLGIAVRGLLSNPMNQAHASMIPLETIADYLWNSGAYNPDREHQHAIVAQYGPDAPTLLAPFFAAYNDYWWQDNIFKPLYVETRKPIDLPLIDRTALAMESSAQALTGPTFQKLLPELSPMVGATRDRAVKVAGDPAFQTLADGRLQWRDDDDLLYATYVGQPPALDGDFAKWQGGPLYVLRSAAQITDGADLWKGPEQFSARVALAWDEQHLYLGVDVTDPALYQPFRGDDIAKGDTFNLILDTAFRQDFLNAKAGPDDHLLTFSPGNFTGVAPDLLPPGPSEPTGEIRTAWKRTAAGYSGDIAIPAAFFGGNLHAGLDLGLVIAAQKVLPPAAGQPASVTDEENLQRIVFSSKSDALFPVHFGNPATYQRAVLIQPGDNRP
ncbi:MAG TPA: beta-N-acetylglucosaminidase domain-containing protein [Terriglobia bacterium]|nr:beta-N-acetylglucosaminidase domain-containing protein [Terriglobia bacterium]